MAALAVPITGCIDGGSEDGGDSDGGADGSAGSDGGDSSKPGWSTGTGESGMNRVIFVGPECVRENVTVVSVEEVEATDTQVEVNVTLRNDSDEAVRMDYYGLNLIAFKSETIARKDSERYQDRFRGRSQSEYDSEQQEPTPPGESVTLGLSIEVPQAMEFIIRSYMMGVGIGRQELPDCSVE
jgi:hypothetical protein